MTFFMFFIAGVVVAAVTIAVVLFYLATHAHGTEPKETKQSIESVDETSQYRYSFRTIINKIRTCYDNVGIRIIECGRLEKLLGKYERSITDGTKYRRWYVAIIRDVLYYNKVEDMPKEIFAYISHAIEEMFTEDCNDEAHYVVMCNKFLDKDLKLRSKFSGHN